MRSEKLKTNGNVSSTLFEQLARQKKKTISAVCLIAVMGFMWARVLMRKSPQSAAAALMMQSTGRLMAQTAEKQSNPESKVSFIEMPKIEGRNDVLTRDFFGIGSWQQFVKGRSGSTGTGEGNVVWGDGGEEYVRQIAEKLKLETIVMGQNPEAFINDRLLGIGGKLPISLGQGPAQPGRDGVGMYECEVIGIEENTVYMRCGKSKITLRLGQTVEAVD